MNQALQTLPHQFQDYPIEIKGCKPFLKGIYESFNAHALKRESILIIIIMMMTFTVGLSIAKSYLLTSVSEA